MPRAVKKKKSRGVLNASEIAASIFFAVYIAKSGAVEYLLNAAQSTEILASFIAGVFFTSLLTLAPATVVLAEISQSYSLFATAFFGAIGAVVGDLLIFFFIRDGAADNVSDFLKALKLKRVFTLLKHKRFKWISPVVGAFIIASPLPDELGIALMGFSKIKLHVLVPISFVMNFIGILAVGLVAQSLI